MAMMMQMMRSGGDPNAILQQMANQNPQVRQFMRIINGKTPRQLENITRNAARERGVNLEDLMKQFGLR